MVAKEAVQSVDFLNRCSILAAQIIKNIKNGKDGKVL